jgi:hypothetical protein
MEDLSACLTFCVCVFIDDDLSFESFLKGHRVDPSWNAQEAANGETALHLVELQDFKVTFMTSTWQAVISN